ncbi:MAG TPA: nuclear transport factor 2 family protein [Pyrinomonadaceae bacterium]|jgi:ketosteroid isomerase-like protein|nr:nuclear transport factor 2 family protein [Pyrinomonadaceae bacterium]
MNKFLIAFSLLLCFLDVTAAQTSDSREAEIRRVISQYDSMWNKKDAKSVAKFLADDYVYFTSTGGLTDRKKTLEFLVSPDYKLTFVERSEIVVHNAGDTVIVSSRWKGRGTYGKEAINDDQRCGIVLVKENKMWKLLSEHCVQIATQ